MMIAIKMEKTPTRFPILSFIPYITRKNITMKTHSNSMMGTMTSWRSERIALNSFFNSVLVKVMLASFLMLPQPSRLDAHPSTASS